MASPYAIKASGGDYTTIQGFADDLDTLGDVGELVGELYAETYDSGSTQVQFNSTVHNDTTIVILRPAVGEEGDGTPGGGGPLVRGNPSGSWGVLNVQQASTTTWIFENFQIEAYGSAASALRFPTNMGTGDISRTHRMVLWNSAGSSSETAILADDLDAVHNIQNTTIAGFRYGVLAWSTNANAKVYNTTIGLPTGSSPLGIWKCGVATNCFVFGFNTGYSGVTTVTTSASSDTSGTSGLTSLTAADELVSVATPATADFHVKPAGTLTLEDAGTDLGTTPDDVEFDIDGEDRDAGAVTWDVGCHELELPAAAGGATPKGVLGLALDGPLRRAIY